MIVIPFGFEIKKMIREIHRRERRQQVKKTVVRVAFLTVVFILSLVFFYKNMEWHSYSENVTTVKQSKATLPLVSFYSGGYEINQTKGYVVPMDESCLRESITPISSAKEFGIYVNEKECSVKKLVAEILTVPDLNEISEAEAVSFEEGDDGRLFTKLKIEEKLEDDTEYLLKVTLITSEANRIYYYTRLKVSTFGSLAESMKFINGFHESTFDKEKVYDYSDVMESNDNETITDYSHIDINSSMDALSYGMMEPEEVYKVVPLISEYNESYASVAIDFFIKVTPDENEELYRCRETYRFQYSSFKTFLYNYDRTMDRCFEGGEFTEGKAYLGIGISSNPEINIVYSDNKKQFLFEYQGGVWHYDTENNRLVCVLTYVDYSDLSKCRYDDYGFTLLSADDEGNADFAVYGYIGKGEYEGRCGIVYYTYYAETRRIEEKMFIPTDETRADIEGEFGRVSYTTDNGVYFFSLGNTLYSYELETNVLKTEAEDMGENWIYFDDVKYVCYDENPVNYENTRIVIYDISEDETYHIEAADGEIIGILGSVDNRIIYGRGLAADASYYDNGKNMMGYSQLLICESDGSIVKEYTAGEGTYIADIESLQGVIDINLYRKTSDGGEDKRAEYEFDSNDVIVILAETDAVPEKNITSASDEKHKLQYYLKLPSAVKELEKPEIYEAKATVITKDTSVYLDYAEKQGFYVTAYGRIIQEFENPAEAIKCADEIKGSVVDSKGMLVWARGVSDRSHSISGVNRYTKDNVSTSQSVVLSLAEYNGREVSVSDINIGERSYISILKEYVSENIVLAEGAELSSLYYYISSDRPVIAKYNGYFVLITAYSADSVTFIDPYQGKNVQLTLESAKKSFEESGNTYYVYY